MSSKQITRYCAASPFSHQSSVILTDVFKSFKLFRLLLAFVLISMVQSAQAQIYTSKTDAVEIDKKLRFKELKQAPTVTIEAPTAEKSKKLNDEDIIRDKGGNPYRFATLIDTDINTKNAGVWQTIDDKLVWIVEIEATKAKSISLNFKNLSLPAAGELYLITKKKDYIHGPIIAKNIQKEVSLMPSEVMPGSRVWVYYIQPKYEQNTPNIQVASIGYGYRGYDLYSQSKLEEVKVEERGVGDSGSCNVNVNDTKGDCFRMEQNAVAIVLLDMNTATCTGTIINNTAQNLRSFIITARHCTILDGQTIDFSKVSVRFKFWQNNTNTILFSGTQLIARSNNADFALLEMIDIIKPNQGIFYLGWSRSTSSVPSTIISHPSGDHMKITGDNENRIADPNPSTFNVITLPSNSTWLVNFGQSNDFGTLEGGSSGSSLLNPSHQITGTLSGANLGCSNSTGNKKFGRFDVSWNGGGTNSTRLSNWLDPSNTNMQDQLATFLIDAGGVIPCTNLVQEAWAPLLKMANGTTYTYNWTSSPNITIIGSANLATYKANAAQAFGVSEWIQCEIRTPTSCGNQLIARARKNMTWTSVSGGLVKATDNSTSQRLPTVSTMTANSCKNFAIDFDDIRLPQSNVSFNWTFSGNTGQFYTSIGTGGKSLTVCCYGSGSLNATVQVINGSGCLTGLSRTYTISYSSGTCAWCLVKPDVDEKLNMEISSIPFTSEHVTVFPNPTSQSQVIIQLPSHFNLNGSTITLFDIYGKIVNKLRANDIYHTVNVGNLNNGIYLIETSDGIYRQNTRLMIHK